MQARASLVTCVCLLACGCGKQQKSTTELLGDLKGADEGGRLIAVRLLPERKGDAAQVIPALIDALKDNKTDIRLSAAIGLGQFGDQAKDAIPALQAAEHDHDARVREAAGKAISRIDPSVTPKVVPSPSRRR
jgi:HEAT repeat protein